ncbi:MAG: flagellar biosynthesis protein FlhB [Sedimentisphaerales bacterium]|nr:flagellar biosynthesis protein FlhB [Sedimentisphaerales bacterium]
MADTNKTHQPTARRLQKAREEGQVTQSAEMVSAVTLVTMLAVCALLGPWFISWGKNELVEGLSCRSELIENSQVFIAYINSKIIGSMLIMAPFLLALAVCGVSASIMISGLNFTPKTLAWKTSELNPVNGLKQLFSPESLVKLLLSIVKLAFIGLLVYLYLSKKITYLATLQWIDVNHVLSSIGGVVLGAVIRICLGLLVIGAIDWFYRQWRYIEKLKMSRQEVKEENRDSDGPPEVKSKLRRKQYELGMRRMLKKVPQASVVLVNPTHVAVALYYESGKTSSPIVIAKGGDHMCEKIKEIARSYGVPIIRRPALAREIYATVKLDQPIPEKLFTAVAEVLAVIYRLKHAYSK